MKLIKRIAMNVTNKNFSSNGWNFDRSSFFCEKELESKNRLLKYSRIRSTTPFHFLFLPARWNTVTKVFIRFLRWPFFKRTIIFLCKFSFHEFTDVFITRNLTLRLHSSYSLWKVIYVTRLLNTPRMDESIDDRSTYGYLKVTFGHWIGIICKISSYRVIAWVYYLQNKVFKFISSIG